MQTIGYVPARATVFLRLQIATRRPRTRRETTWLIVPAALTVMTVRKATVVRE